MVSTGKIGLIIEVVSEGERKAYTSASAQDWDHVYFDVRSYLQKISNKNYSSFVDFVCYGDNVALYLICRSIPGRPGDAICGMITIPSDVKISGKELEDVISQIKDELAKSSQNHKLLDELFDKEYSLKQTKSQCHNSSYCEHFAYQKYGKSNDYQLYELLDKNLFNACYNTFKAVFLINEGEEFIPQEDVVELSQDQIDKYAIIKYPENCGCRLFIDNREFTSDYPAERDSVVSITAKRRNYNSKKIEVKVDSSCVDISSRINNLKWNFVISKDWFIVVDKISGAELNKFSLKINGNKITDRLVVPETDLSEVILEVESSGYEPYKIKLTEGLDLKNPGNGIKIYLTKSPATYTYIIADTSIRDSVTFSVKNVNYDVYQSPIDRYEVRRVRHDNEGEKIYLQKKTFFTIKNIGITLGIIVVILGLGFGGGWSLNRLKNKADLSGIVIDISKRKFDDIINNYKLSDAACDSLCGIKNRLDSVSSEDSDKNNKDKTYNVPIISKDIIADLLSFGEWDKSQFEKVQLVDLFDAVNTMNYEEVIRIYNDKIKKLKINFNDEIKYCSWNCVIKLCQLNAENQDYDGVTFNKFSLTDSIDLSKWRKEVVLNKKTRWNKAEFKACHLTYLYGYLIEYNKNKLSSDVQKYINNSPSGKLTKERIEKLNTLHIPIGEYEEENDYIDISKWRANIDDKAKKTTDKKIGTL